LSGEWEALLAGLVQSNDAPAETVAISQEDFSAFFAGVQAPAPEAASAFLDELPKNKFAPTGEGLNSTERKNKHRKMIKQRSINNIAVLDFETDPFDNLLDELEIRPFTACLYSDNFEPVIIWEENNELFIEAVLKAINDLPEEYTIYAHNGGKFDYMFLLSKLRGEVRFKGRGIMSAMVGKHELRDSFHIIPDKLANYKKDHIEYKLMKRGKRNQFKQQIIDYMVSDCRYLLDLVKGFATRFGLKISIGQAAMSRLRQHYKFDRLEEYQDEYFRQFFFGGRVECLEGQIRRKGHFKLFDVNSMYPAVMATFQHPIGNVYFKQKEGINEDTIFIDLTCTTVGKIGPFVMRDGEKTHAPLGRHRFKTTIWEYNIAKKHGLFTDEEIHTYVDIPKRTDFSKFVLPLYEDRQKLKAIIAQLKKEGKQDTNEYDEAVKDDMFMKFLLNNGYGKFAQNPRRYKEHYITELDGYPPGDEEWKTTFYDNYAVHHRANPSYRFNNVATGASITGAARATLLDALCSAVNPLYCDTDSIVCDELPNVEIHKTKLGAWDLEKEISEIIVNGKKSYSYIILDTNEIVNKSKGSGNILSKEDWEKMNALPEKEQEKKAKELTYQNAIRIFEGETVLSLAKGITLTKDGNQDYMKRRIRATTHRKDEPQWASTLTA